jgi:hypothetical protein
MSEATKGGNLSAKETLEQYTNASRDLAIFDSVYSDVLRTRAELVKAAEEKLAILKKEARIDGEVENRHFALKVTTKQKRFYNASILVNMFPASMELSGVILQTVDREMADHYREIGVIPEEVAQAAEVVEPMTSAISVKTKLGFGRVSAAKKAEIKQKTGG